MIPELYFVVHLPDDIPMKLTPQMYMEMRDYIARRVSELVREERLRLSELGLPRPIAEGERGDLARRAKGEWMIETYAAALRAGANREFGSALLVEVISDIYGVPR